MTAATKTPQHLEALERANRLRFAQSALLKQLSNNQVSLEAVLADDDAVSLSFDRVLGAMPHRSDSIREGEIRRSIGAARKIANTAGVSLAREIGTLRCALTRDRLLEAAYDVIGQFAWVYEADMPPKLTKRRPTRKPDAATIAVRDAALAKGNAIRSRRKEMKELLRSGEMTLAEALEDPASQTWPIGKLVVHVARIDPKTGEAGQRSSAKTHMTLRQLRIPPTMAVSELHPNRKERLIAELAKTLTMCRPKKARVSA